jgi:hypothetical protein
VQAGRQVLVRIAPRVLGQLLEIAAFLPAVGGRAAGRLLDEGLQALLGGRIALVVELVQLERGHQGGDVDAGRGHARLAGAAQQLGHDEGAQDTDDDHDDHDFDEGETALAALPCETMLEVLHRCDGYGRKNSIRPNGTG